ncbi:MAG: RimK family alpha-L-glutamate ligase, partial [Clostridiaceae bacterium]|nr:RimK family alpha-L-glutamate ligase [Clostridiaceae bacterium]
MLEGWLVVNRFLRSDKFSELYDWLLKAARDSNIELRLIHNDALLIDLQDGPIKMDHPAFCLFWDKDI